ncbi:MAG: prolipoprotein diacylglyceryl transferase [Candidatus Limnocylindrales bacterium]
MGSLLAAIQIGLRPYLSITDPLPLLLRWDAIAAGVTVVVAIVLAALLARAVDDTGTFRPMRLDDLLYIVIGILPGAVIGGRLLHGIDFSDVYAADPGALLDPGRGTLSMLGAVLGGSLSGVFVARVLGTEWRRWLDVAAPTLLMTIAGAKFAQFLGGGGQGVAWDGPWAVAFVGAGPWTSLMADVPAQPSQLYEAFWALAGLLPLSWIDSLDAVAMLPARFRQEDEWLAERKARGEEVAPVHLRFGLLYLFALAWWLVGRFLIGFSWRDDVTIGPLRVEQALALAALAVVALLVVGATRRQPPRRGPVPSETASTGQSRAAG